MAEYIEGKRPIIEAQRSRVPLQRILLADNAKKDALISDILRKAKAAGTEVQTVPRSQLDKVSQRGSHQGVIAQARPFAYASLQQVIDRALAQFEGAADAVGEQSGEVQEAVATTTRPTRGASASRRALIVLCDHITDAGNLGAIARSAEVVGAAGIVLPNKRSAHVTAATYKSSAGAIAHLPVAQVANIKQAIERCKQEGFWVAGATEHASTRIWDANLAGKIVLVMGNEGEGLARLTRESCDFLVALPQVGSTASLNVAQSATACMYEWLRQNS